MKNNNSHNLIRFWKPRCLYRNTKVQHMKENVRKDLLHRYHTRNIIKYALTKFLNFNPLKIREKLPKSEEVTKNLNGYFQE